MPIFVLNSRAGAGSARPTISLRRTQIRNKGEYPSANVAGTIRAVESFTAVCTPVHTPSSCCQRPTTSGAYARVLQEKASPFETHLVPSLNIPRSPIHNSLSCSGISLNRIRMQKTAVKIRRLCAFQPRNSDSPLPTPRSSTPKSSTVAIPLFVPFRSVETLLELELTLRNKLLNLEKEKFDLINSNYNIRNVDSFTTMSVTDRSDISNLVISLPGSFTKQFDIDRQSIDFSNEILNVVVTESECRCDVIDFEDTDRNKILSFESSGYLIIKNNAKLFDGNEISQQQQITSPPKMKSAKRPKPPKQSKKQEKCEKVPTSSEVVTVPILRSLPLLFEEMITKLEIQSQYQYQLLDSEAKRERRAIESLEVCNFIRNSKPAAKDYTSAKLKKKMRILEAELASDLPHIPQPPSASGSATFSRKASLFSLPLI